MGAYLLVILQRTVTGSDGSTFWVCSCLLCRYSLPLWCTTRQGQEQAESSSVTSTKCTGAHGFVKNDFSIYFFKGLGTHFFQRFSNLHHYETRPHRKTQHCRLFETWLNKSPALSFTKAFELKFSPIDLFRKLRRFSQIDIRIVPLKHLQNLRWFDGVDFPWLIRDTRFRCDTRTCGKMTFGVPFFLSTLVFRTIALMVLITFLQMWTGVILFMLFFFNVLTSLSVGDDFSR